MRKSDIGPYQGTVARSVRFAGVGLHSGKMVKVEVLPADPNSGIVFVRTDIANSQPILAHPYNVVSTQLCTTLGNQDYRISTVEHLMAAFAGLGVDNAVVKVNASELPILDGSAAPFVDKLTEVGIQVQNAKRRILRPKQIIEVKEGDQFMILEPLKKQRGRQSNRLEFICSIDFPCSEVIGTQSLRMQFSRRSFMDLCEARTFCHEDDIVAMRARDLARGGSLDNAVVVNDKKVMNNDGLRFKDEFVRHKLLDCIGDLALLGARLTGRLTMHKAGHRIHSLFIRKLMSRRLCAVHPYSNRIDSGDGLGLVAMSRNEL